MNTLLDTAIALHEMFITYMQAGFTEQQALALVCAMVVPPRTES